MKSEQINLQIKQDSSNILLHGNCVELLSGMSSGSAAFVLTDPPYMVNYSSSDGRTVPNDDNDVWLKPAFREIFRVLRWNRFSEVPDAVGNAARQAGVAFNSAHNVPGL